MRSGDRAGLQSEICGSASNYHNEKESKGIGMKLLHADVRLDDLESSVGFYSEVRFYSTLFATEPALLRPDYAKWMLDEPEMNFAITARSTSLSLDHFGLQVESGEDLAVIAQRLDPAAQWS
jgi:hypothetical protein